MAVSFIFTACKKEQGCIDPLATNYNIDTYKKKIYIYGIAQTKEEQKEVVNEGKSIPDVERVIASILLVEDLRIQKN